MKHVKKIIIFAAFLFFTFCFLLLTSNCFAEEAWKLRKDKDGIQVFTRKVEGSSILEYKASVRLNVPLDQATALYEDAARMPEWFHQCSEARKLKNETGQEKIFYFSLDMPWPVSDRDVIYRQVQSQDPETQAVLYRLSQTEGELPPEKDKVRIPYLKTLWRFTPVDEHHTEVYFQQHSDAGGHLPSVLVNQLVVDIPFKTLNNFRRLLESGGNSHG